MNIFKTYLQDLPPLQVTPVQLARLMKELRHMHWRESCGRCVPCCRRGTTTDSPFAMRRVAFSRVRVDGATEADLNLHRLFLSSSLLSTLKAIRVTVLLTGDGSHGPTPVPHRPLRFFSLSNRVDLYFTYYMCNTRVTVLLITS
jgi:hypothetical protein